MKICLVSSAGGHLYQLIQLEPLFSSHDHFFIINNRTPLKDGILNRAYFISRSHKDWKFFLNLVEAFRVLRKERPDVIISTGAGCIVPVSIVAKLFFGCPTIYIESFAAVYRPTLTGRIMYRLADKFLYQWEYLSRVYPKGIYSGSIF
jgi:UDP-N-acetylglucosamine:LPS N-acetylglucosamine transferase